MVFYQTSAPSGWTLDTTHNDKALRVVSSSGGGTGGSHGLSSPPSANHTHTGPSHTHTTAGHVLIISEMPSHNHNLYVNNSGGANFAPSGDGDNILSSPSANLITSTGGGGSHDHGATSASGTGATGSDGTGNTGNSGPTAFAPKYIDVIVCTRN